MSRSLVLLAALFLASVPAIASADGPSAAASAAPDEVSLKNGGIIRGTVVTLDPGHEVVISVPGVKDARTIPWAEVADVERGKYSDKSAAAPARPTSGYGAPPPNSGYGAPPPPPQAAPASGQGVVRLHIETPDPVTLYERRGMLVQTVYGSAYLSATKMICDSPCDQMIDGRQGDFSVEGASVPGATFRLSDRQGNVTATVEPGSKAGRGMGIALTAVGGAGMLAGLLMMVFGGISAATPTYDSNANQVPSSGNTLLVPGGIVLGAGAAGLIGGIVLIMTSKTHVELAGQPSGRTAAAAPKPRYWIGEF